MSKEFQMCQFETCRQEGPQAAGGGGNLFQKVPSLLSNKRGGTAQLLFSVRDL